jgi:hypothetical protein
VLPVILWKIYACTSNELHTKTKENKIQMQQAVLEVQPA